MANASNSSNAATSTNNTNANTSAAATGDLSICEKGSGGGLFLPLGGDAEQEWDSTMRAFLYLAGLFYLFMAVNIAADYFMSAVEAITSTKVRRKDKATDRWVTRKKWNDTVANLTLLALGSSAPEILLSCIEIAGNEFYSGALGPGTIVGSAAFNLLVIISVCVISIPDGEVRYIKAVSVYHITVIFSLFAYFWLLVMVTLWTPDIITIPEAVITLLMFFFLVSISFCADIGKLQFMALEKSPPVAVSAPSKASEEKLALTVGGGDEAAGGPADIKGAAKDNPKHSKASKGSHSQAVHPRVRRASQHLHHSHSHQHGHHRSEGVHDHGHAQINEELQERQQDATEPFGARADGRICENGEAIVNPFGVITFRTDSVDVHVRANPVEQHVQVLRRNGHMGKVTCKYRTESLTAVDGFDYEAVEGGKLEFADGEVSKVVTLKILPKRYLERNDAFQLILEELEGGAQFNPNDDGGEDEALCTFHCLNDYEDERKAQEGFCAKVKEWFDPDSISYGLETWRDQIKDALVIDAPEEGEDGAAPPSPTDYVIHILSLPWKVMFALISPPPNWLGGWLLFCLALCYIGFVTALISDLASLFGCCANLDDSVTAITVVALGTSLPDMFASMSSAKADEHADASIVNVTGSNSVNVFLGIGLPWTCAAIYWQSSGATPEWAAKYPAQAKDYPGGGFVVIGGTLGFSVFVFCSLSIIALITLRVRRLKFGGELGGPKISKTVSSLLLLCLWFTYIGCSILRVGSEDAEVIKYPVLGLSGIAVVVGLANEFCGKRPQPPPPEEPKDIQAAQFGKPFKEELDPVIETTASQETKGTLSGHEVVPVDTNEKEEEEEKPQAAAEATPPKPPKAKSVKKSPAKSKATAEAEADESVTPEDIAHSTSTPPAKPPAEKGKAPPAKVKKAGAAGTGDAAKKKKDGLTTGSNTSSGSSRGRSTQKGKEKE